MLIELEEPFKSKWRKGYLVNDGDGRQRVVLYNSRTDISGLTYARYLMCVKLGYVLPTELEVDHIDEDKSNDDVNNLQVLTKQQNIVKQHVHYVENTQVSIGYECAHCGTAFILSESEVRKRIKNSKTDLAFCSHECSAIHLCSDKTIDNSIICRIKELRSLGFSSYKISEIVQVSRNTVMKYWNP